MGNSSVIKDQSIIIENLELPKKHPRLEKATFKKTEHREYIAALMPLANAKDYEDWLKQIEHSPVAQSEYALNPLAHAYKKAGMCGSGGTASVICC